jgi:hypothetical protein
MQVRRFIVDVLEAREAKRERPAPAATPDCQRPLSSWKVSEGSGSGPRRDPHRPLF